MRNFLITLTIAVFTLSMSHVAQAQVLSSLSASINVSPQNPSVGQVVRLNTTSAQIDLSKATIRWSVDGDLIDQGVGLQSVQTIAPDESFSVELSITTQDGQTVSRTRSVLGPKSILLWEAVDSYTPPFYKGKALTGKTGDVKFSVINTSGGSNSYSWEYNNQPQQNQNREYFIARGDLFASRRLATATVFDGANSQTLSSSVQMDNPERISLYRQTPALGTLYNKEIAVLPAGTQSIVAVPYFFPQSAVEDGDIRFTWRLNGTEAGSDQNAIVVNGVPGSVDIRIVVENIRQTLQKAQRTVTIQGL